MNLLKFRKLKKSIDFLKRHFYVIFLQKLVIKENIILLEAQHGKSMDGNVFYLMRELQNNADYKNFNIYLSVDKRNIKIFQNKLAFYKLNKIKLVVLKSLKYYKILSTAKFLINNNTFLPFFIKRSNQIYLNTWHGTPLKTLGKEMIGSSHKIGNAQRNFASTNILLSPNKYTTEKLLDDYMVDSLFQGKIIYDGYPRNEVFFNYFDKEELLEKFELHGKQIIVYMPTWRGDIANVKSESFNTIISTFLIEIDKRLKSNQILFVNLHPVVKDVIDYSNFKNIFEFPLDYETYHFLSISNILITDYSSVLFDYVNTRNKIIIFDYDREDYEIERGFYFDLDFLPFPKTNNISDLVSEINSPKQYDETKFTEYFCKYDNREASKKILSTMINHKLSSNTIDKQQKETVLIYPGNLAKNGITTALFNFLYSLDLKKRDYYLLINERNIVRYTSRLKDVPKGVRYLTFTFHMNLTLGERLIRKLHFSNKTKFFNFKKTLDKIYKREYQRLFDHTKFDHVIHFSGYGAQTISLLNAANSNNIIYVHSDMLDEIRTRKNQHFNTLKNAYETFKKVAIVSADMLDSVKKISPKAVSIQLVQNSHTHDFFVKESKKPIKFDEETISNVTLNNLKKILKTSNTVFVTIGRFSPEKGHLRLINTFNRFWSQDDMNSYLIIIGGHGNLFDKTIEYAKKLPSANNIIIIQSLNNPFSILVNCDLFILPSFYEGLGLVLLEAESLGIPSISTNIKGPTNFLKKHGGNLVANNEEGIYQGMLDFINGHIHIMNIDFKKYNKVAIEQFEKLLIY